jgi:hypothetical protein
MGVKQESDLRLEYFRVRRQYHFWATLKMKAAISSEISVTVWQLIRLHILEKKWNIYQDGCDNLKLCEVEEFVLVVTDIFIYDICNVTVVSSEYMRTITIYFMLIWTNTEWIFLCVTLSATVPSVCRIWGAKGSFDPDSWFPGGDMNFESSQLETSEAQHLMCYIRRAYLWF